MAELKIKKVVYETAEAENNQIRLHLSKYKNDGASPEDLKGELVLMLSFVGEKLAGKNRSRQMNLTDWVKAKLTKEGLTLRKGVYLVYLPCMITGKLWSLDLDKATGLQLMGKEYVCKVVSTLLDLLDEKKG